MSDKSVTYVAAELGSKLRGDDPGEAVRSFAGLVDDPELIRLLNYYDGLLAEPVEETAIGELIIENAATKTIDSAVRNGSVSQMKSAVGLTGQSEDGRDLFGRVASRLEHEGSIGLVFGSPGSGKTATTIDSATVWQVRTGGTVISNTPWNGADAQFDSDREMLEQMASYQGPVLALVDEVAQELSGYGTAAKQAQSFSDSLLLIRKQEREYGEYAKKGSVLLVGHTRTKTAKAIRRVASFGIEKPKQSQPGRARLLESDGGKDNWDEIAEFQGLTDTAAKYGEYNPSNFEMLESRDGAEDEDDGSAEDAARDEQIKTALRAVVVQGLSYEKASKLVDFSDEWVGKRVREWRDDGLHRELVDLEPEDLE